MCPPQKKANSYNWDAVGPSRDWMINCRRQKNRNPFSFLSRKTATLVDNKCVNQQIWYSMSINCFATWQEADSFLLPLPTINQFYWSTNVKINCFSNMKEIFSPSFHSKINQYCQSTTVLINLILSWRGIFSPYSCNNPLLMSNQQTLLINYFTTWYEADFVILPLPTINQFNQSTNVLINLVSTWYEGDLFLLPLTTISQ